MLQTSSFNQTHVLVASNSISLSCFLTLTPLLNPLPVLIILVALKILREILSSTRSLMINTHPLVECLENSSRKVKQFRVIPRIASIRLVYCSSIHWPNLGRVCLGYCGIRIYSGIGEFFVCQTNDYFLIFWIF